MVYASDSVEFKTLLLHRETINIAIRNNLISLGAALVASGIISPENFKSLYGPSSSSDVHADMFISWILEGVKMEPQRYHVLCRVLLRNWVGYDGLLCCLFKTYQSLVVEERKHFRHDGTSPPPLTAGMY